MVQKGALYKAIEEAERGNKEEVLSELYVLVDEYNQFVVDMDRRFDLLISRLEKLND